MIRASIIVAALAATANAQPTPPPQQPVFQLTAEDAELLQRGEISDAAHLGGGAASLVLGFGVGQAIQGRFGEKGWIFAVGESVTLLGMVVGTVQGFDSGGDIPLLFIGSVIGYAVFRFWDVIDAFVAPPKHNDRIRMLRFQLGMPVYTRVIPYVHKSAETSTAGLVFRF